MKKKLLTITTGFALFSMFFGSGNLVFPLVVGKESDGNVLMATLGILLTGVLVPFLGVIAMMLFKGDSRKFFGVMGAPATFWFPLIALSLMGPFGVLARCITVAHGSFRMLFPETSLIVFSLMACGIIFACTLKKNRIVPLVGFWLTPFLLCALAAISFMGFWHGMPPASVPEQSFHALKNGIFQGYQTMDLLAAFFFSIFIMRHLEQHDNAIQDKKLVVNALLIGAGLLSAVYFALVFLGSVYSSELANIPPQELLGRVAAEAIGPYSAPVVCVAVILACFTTAVVLASLFADFLRTEVTKEKISDHIAMMITLGIAFSISTLEFSGIARFLAPILETLYPALIVLTLLNICNQLWGMQYVRWPVACTFAAKLFF